MDNSRMVRGPEKGLRHCTNYHYYYHHHYYYYYYYTTMYYYHVLPYTTMNKKKPMEGGGGVKRFIPLTGWRTLLRWSFSLLALRFRLQQMKMTTATMTVAQMAALAAMMILSMCDAASSSMRISRHWANGTVSGVTFESSSDTTHTTRLSYYRLVLTRFLFLGTFSHSFTTN